jgi:hypothetical protein
MFRETSAFALWTDILKLFYYLKSSLLDKMSKRIADWEAIIHKTVRSSNGNLIGSVDAVDDNSILVSTEGAKTRYKIPKHVVQGFDGHQVSINVQKPELERFKSDAKEGFKEVK